MNTKLSEIQKVVIQDWDGERILSISPNGSTHLQSFQSKQTESYQSEEFWCAMKVLDDLGIPRVDERGQTYSIVGRIMFMTRAQYIRDRKLNQLGF
jgi:hypothetical protein